MWLDICSAAFQYRALTNLDPPESLVENATAEMNQQAPPARPIQWYHARTMIA